jgi:membrane associated rhomboid family serine protease
MGIYDRTYYRDEESGSLLNGRSMVFWLIVVNVVVFFLQSLLEGAPVPYLELNSNLFREPWQCWRLVTYGFVHIAPWHIIWNMLGLYFFGRPMEEIYGAREFLRIYLMLVIMSGLVWVLAEVAAGYQDLGHTCIGASGAVMGVLILFVLHFPQQIIYFFGVIPVRAWVLGAIFLGVDIFGAMPQARNDHVAHTAHLAGALFAFLYYRFGWNLGRMIPTRWPRLRRPTKLKLHDPEAEERQLARQVDAILEKISRDGEASLTKQERRTLEQASRRYQRRRQ